MKIERFLSAIYRNSQDRSESDESDTYERYQETLPRMFYYHGSQGPGCQGESHHPGEPEP